MQDISKNKRSHVPSGIKIFLVFITFFLATNIIGAVVIFIYSSIIFASKGISPDEINNFSRDISSQLTNISSGLGFFMNILQCLVMIFTVFLFWRLLDKKPIREIGLINIKKGNRDLINGFIIGAVSLIIVFFLLLASGNVILLKPLWSPNFNLTLITGLIVFIFVGIDEEMFARGYCMTVLKQTRNKYVMVIVSAAIFSLMHSLNPGLSVLSYINLFLFGLLTAYMFILSGNLWLSIGYHIAWNYFEGNICGFLVSGQGVTGLYSLKVPADNIINGGKFGPEGGLAVTFILLINFLYLWKFYKPVGFKN